MLVNNEVGTIEPLSRIAKLVRRRAPDAIFHTDAVQAMPWLDVATEAAEADLIAISAHKFGGPKGAGVLVVRERANASLAARQFGGGQERERRSGTSNVAAIVGMAVAARVNAARRDEVVPRVAALRDRLADGLVAAVPDLVETGVPRREVLTRAEEDAAHEAPAVPLGPVAAPRRSSGTVQTVRPVFVFDRPPDRSHKVAGSCHVGIEGVETESLLYLLERDEVFASGGASCAAGAMEPSHVLAAMGVSRPRAAGALRLSLGATSTDADIDAALEVIPAAVTRLRENA